MAEFFNRSATSMEENSWFDLSKSGYAKVIFSDLYHSPGSSVGCRFQITDNVHEDPSDYVGLFKVGYENLNQCLVFKLLSETECEEDGKMIRCTFKCDELPALENGFYQFLYVTRDKEVCGASMPFEIKQPKTVSTIEDIVADNIEDDFLVVRSTVAEQNRILQSQIDKISLNGMVQEKEYSSCIKKLSKEKTHLEYKLSLISREKDKLSSECKRVVDEKNAICKSNDETIKHLEQQISGLAQNIEETYRSFEELEKTNNILETEKNKIMLERNQLEDAYNKLRKEFEIVGATVELLQKELRLKDESVDEDCASLASQLEDAKLMIAALEDSKLLVRNEVTQLSDSNTKFKRNHEQLKSQNLYLEGKLKENDALTEKLRKSEKELICQIRTLQSKYKDSETVNEKLMHSQKELKCQIYALDMKLKDNETKTAKPGYAVKELRCQVLALELKLKDSDTIIEKMKKKNRSLKNEIAALKLHFGDVQNQQSSSSKVFNESVNKVQFVTEKKLFASEPVTEEPKILNTSCNQIDVESVKCQCDELRRELNDKDSMINKLKEECLKKDAVVEYLSKEKDNTQKNCSVMEEALNDCMLRLKEAADIYKKQYLEVDKLKKKLEKAKWTKKNRLECSSVKDDMSSSAETGDETLTGNVRSAPNRSSDSDTGEHVLGLSLEAKKYPIASAPVALESIQSCSSPEAVASSTESPDLSKRELNNMFGQDLDLTYLAVAARKSPLSRESPELQTMIDQNIADLSQSKSKEEEQFSIPCPVCDADIGIYPSSSDEMIKHLEVQHKQQMCPVCGKLYDMTLHPKYLQFHIEDHFSMGNN